MSLRARKTKRIWARITPDDEAFLLEFSSRIGAPGDVSEAIRFMIRCMKLWIRGRMMFVPPELLPRSHGEEEG